jgi:hypothetical protein
MSMAKETKPNIAQVEKLAGNINPQTNPMGTTIGKKPFLKSPSTSLLSVNILAIYTNNTTFAKSLV